MAAAQAISDAVDAAFQNGDLIVDRQGVYKQVFDIGGIFVTVRGRVVNGVVRIGTAWIPP